MNSFYGGKQGASFIITQWFEATQDMENAKALINYGEYVMIKGNNKDRGNVYTKNANNEMILVCNLVGPSGGLAISYLDSYEELEAKSENFVDGEIEGNLLKSHFVKGSYTIDNKGLVGGDESNEIKWITINEMEDDKPVLTRIGLQIPYPVIKINQVESTTDGITFTEIKDDNRPFYHEWAIGIPGGLSNLDSLKVIDSNADESEAAKGLKTGGILLFVEEV